MENLKPTLANSPPLTPIILLEKAAAVYSGCHSIIYNSKTYTWSETYDRCLQGASAISNLGIGRNDVVSVVSPNVPAAYELHFAVPMAGAVLNNISTQIDHPKTIAKLLHQSESKLVFVHTRFSTQIVKAVSLLPSDRAPSLVFIKDEEDYDNDDSTTTSKYCGEYEEFIETGDPTTFKFFQTQHPPENEWDPMVLNYAWGATSLPNGVVHSHRACYLKALDSLLDLKIPELPVYLWTLPMSNANGWTFTWGMAAIGGTNIFPSKVDAANIYKLIDQHQVTHMSGSPLLLDMLTEESSGAIIDNLEKKQQVQFLMAANYYLPKSSDNNTILKTDKMEFRVTQGYGLTETIGLMLDTTQGKVNADIIDLKTNELVRRDEVGEIVLRGNSVMLGYLNDYEATTKRLGEDGWFRTRTRGQLLSHGKIRIIGHIMDDHDIVICRGEVINRKVVEKVLYMYPGIQKAELMVNDNDILCARVTFKSARFQPKEHQIIEHCKDNLCSFMVPQKIILIQAAAITRDVVKRGSNHGIRHGFASGNIRCGLCQLNHISSRARGTTILNLGDIRAKAAVQVFSSSRNDVGSYTNTYIKPVGSHTRLFCAHF